MCLIHAWTKRFPRPKYTHTYAHKHTGRNAKFAEDVAKFKVSVHPPVVRRGRPADKS